MEHATAARRAQKLNYSDLADAAQSALMTVSRNIRSGNLEVAEQYSEVLVVIVREMKSRE